MSELQHYYENFRTGWWADEDPGKCPCHGHGWALSEVDTWHTCRIHYRGQRHPDDYEDEEAAKEIDPKVADAQRLDRPWQHQRASLAEWGTERVVKDPSEEGTTEVPDGDDIPF